MNKDGYIQLRLQLRMLGFKDVLDEAVRSSRYSETQIDVYKSKWQNEDSLMYSLRFQKDMNNLLRLEKYKLHVRSVTLPQITVHGFDIPELENKLKEADRLYNDYYSGRYKGDVKDSINQSERELINLYFNDDTSRELAQLLMFKYWPSEHWEPYFSNSSAFVKNYDIEITYKIGNEKMLTAIEAYEKIKQEFKTSKIEGMSKTHVLSDNLFELAQFEISFGRSWLAYNTIPYFLEKEDVYFFKTKDEAVQFAGDNISDYDNYNVLQVRSVRDLLEKIPYGNSLENSIRLDPDINGLHNKEGNAFTDALIDHFETKQLSLFNKQLKTNTMNAENLKYLTDNLKYMGFGEKLNEELQQKMQDGKTDFQLTASVEFNKKSFEATLNFRKSDSSDMYFFNNYQASLEKSNGEKVEHTFYLNKGKGVTAKEAFNLLDGRAVHKDLVTKDGNEYKAWLQLDFENKTDKGFEVKQFHENYGYDLKAAVGKFAVAELNDPEKEKALMASLQKGNVQSVTIEKDGESHKMFMEANPQYKNVTLYDSSMKMVAKESIGQYQAGIEKGAKTVKEELADDKKKDLKQGQKSDDKKLEKKNDKSLLPKKREGKSRGLGVS